jgi:hypothetical protein
MISMEQDEEPRYGCTMENLEQFHEGMSLRNFLFQIPIGKTKFTRGYALNRLYKAMKRRDLMPPKFEEIGCYGSMTVRAKDIFHSEIEKLNKEVDPEAFKECLEAIAFINTKRYIRISERKREEDFSDFDDDDDDDDGLKKKSTYVSKKKRKAGKKDKGDKYKRRKQETFLRLKKAEAEALSKQALASEAQAEALKAQAHINALRDAIGHPSFASLPKESQDAITERYSGLLLNSFSLQNQEIA